MKQNLFLKIIVISSSILPTIIDCGHYYKKHVSEWTVPHYPVTKHHEYHYPEKCCKDKIIHVPVIKKIKVPVVKHVPYPVIKKKVIIKKIKVPVPVIKKKIVYKKVLVPIPVHHHHVVIKKEEKKKKKKKKCKEKKIKPEKVKKMAKEIMESYEKIKGEKEEPCEKKKKKKKSKKKTEDYISEWPYPIAHTYGHDVHIPPAHWPHHVPWM